MVATTEPAVAALRGIDLPMTSRHSADNCKQ
jgi:hypothetical protein